MYLTPPVSPDFFSYTFSASFPFSLRLLIFLEAWLMSPLLDTYTFTFLGAYPESFFMQTSLNLQLAFPSKKWRFFFLEFIYLTMFRVNFKTQPCSLHEISRWKSCPRTPESPSFDIFLLSWFNGCPFLEIDVELKALRGLIVSYNWVDVLLPPLNANSHHFGCQSYLQYNLHVLLLKLSVSSSSYDTLVFGFKLSLTRLFLYPPLSDTSDSHTKIFSFFSLSTSPSDGIQFFHCLFQECHQNFQKLHLDCLHNDFTWTITSLL